MHVKQSSGSQAAIPNAGVLIKRPAGCKSKALVNADCCLSTNRGSEALFLDDRCRVSGVRVEKPEELKPDT
jgi:hypothetical protein